MTVNLKQLERDRVAGLTKILADKQSRLWLVDFLRGEGALLAYSSQPHEAMRMEGRRDVIRAFVEDMKKCDVRPGVRASIYMDITEGTYERAYNQSQGESDDD